MVKEYIDKNLTWKALDVAHLFDNGNPRHIAQQVIEEQPTADVVEVVHGEWIEEWDRKHMVGRCFCNSCRRGTYKDSHLKWIKSAYCPNCGAKMDGKRVE